MSDCLDHEADAIDDLMFGRTSVEGIQDPDGAVKALKTCMYCGVNNLHWVAVGNEPMYEKIQMPSGRTQNFKMGIKHKWKLFTPENKPHMCKKQKIGNI